MGDRKPGTGFDPWLNAQNPTAHASGRVSAGGGPKGKTGTYFGQPITVLPESGRTFDQSKDLAGLLGRSGEGGTDFTKALGRDNRLEGQNYFDKSVETDLIGPESSRNEQFFTDNLNYGLMDNSQLPAPKMLGGNDPMTAALSNRYANEGATAIKSIAADNKATSAGRQSSQAAQASKHLTDVYQNEVTNYMQQKAYETKRHQLYTQWVQANRAAQDAMYGQLFGGFLGAAGAIIGGVAGGPGGAQAGGQAGMGIGGAAGTSASQGTYS